MDGTVEQINGSSVRHPTTIEYSMERDLPVMTAVRNATFITYDQLWEELKYAKIEASKRSFNWRLQRLARAGLVEQLPGKVPYKGAVYTITRSGLECLEACGHGLISLTSETHNLPKTSQIQHYLELAEVRRALRNSGTLRAWTGDLELRSINYSIDCPLAKDYDAIAEVELNACIHRIAIEYERTLKSAERYRELSASIDNEDQIEILVYLTSSLDLLYQIIGHFDVSGMTVAIAPSRAFCDNPLGCRLHIVAHEETARTTLSTLLTNQKTFMESSARR
jgi:hypothetical protein